MTDILKDTTKTWLTPSNSVHTPVPCCPKPTNGPRPKNHFNSTLKASKSFFTILVYDHIPTGTLHKFVRICKNVSLDTMPPSTFRVVIT